MRRRCASRIDHWHKSQRSEKLIGATPCATVTFRWSSQAKKTGHRGTPPMPQRNDTAIWSGLFRISAESGKPLQPQIRQAMVAAILDRQIAASMPLPSCRILAEKLGVARGTVVLAFQQLVDQGFLVAREGRGHFVNPDVLATPAKPHQKAPDQQNEIDWKARRQIAA